MKEIQIAYTNGKYATLKGKSLSVNALPKSVVVKEQGHIIFVGNIDCIRYVKQK
jgi:hypothetical protein